MKDLIANCLSKLFVFTTHKCTVIQKADGNELAFWPSGLVQNKAKVFTKAASVRAVIVKTDPQAYVLRPHSVSNFLFFFDRLKSCLLPIGKLGFRECQGRRQSDQSGYQCRFHDFRIPVSIPVQIAVADCFEQSFLTGAA